MQWKSPLAAIIATTCLLAEVLEASLCCQPVWLVIAQEKLSH